MNITFARSLLMASLLAALGAAPAAWAKTSAVPPPTISLANDQQAREATTEAMRSGAYATTGSIIKGGALLEHSLGNDGAIKLMQTGDTVGKGFDRMDKGVKLLEAYSRGGQQGVFDTGVQMGLDEAVKFGAEQGLKFVQRRAVTTGLSAVSSAGLGLAFEGGTIVGAWSRDNVEINGRSIGNHVDDMYFSFTPDWVKEMATGVKQVDWDSPEYQQQLDADVERRRRQAAFDRVQRENANQAAQMQAHAAAVSAVDEPALPPGPSGTEAWLQVLNQTLAQQPHMVRSMPPAASPRRHCQLDPKTGCHPGHDEASHPGGCKAC